MLAMQSYVKSYLEQRMSLWRDKSIRFFPYCIWQNILREKLMCLQFVSHLQKFLSIHRWRFFLFAYITRPITKLSSSEWRFLPCKVKLFPQKLFYWKESLHCLSSMKCYWKVVWYHDILPATPWPVARFAVLFSGKKVHYFVVVYRQIYMAKYLYFIVASWETILFGIHTACTHIHVHARAHTHMHTHTCTHSNNFPDKSNCITSLNYAIIRALFLYSMYLFPKFLA